jgi:hypothetical protein
MATIARFFVVGFFAVVSVVVADESLAIISTAMPHSASFFWSQRQRRRTLSRLPRVRRCAANPGLWSLTLSAFAFAVRCLPLLFD